MSVLTETNGHAAVEPVLFAPKKLSLGCGETKPDGWFGIDISQDAPGVDLVLDLLPSPWVPWPIKTGSVRQVECLHFVEHIPHWRPGWTQDGWFLFFQEIYRVCAKNATIKIVHPYCHSGRAHWDPTHERSIHEFSWYYLSREWRQFQKLDHLPYPVGVNFEVVTIDGSMQTDEFLTRNDKQQEFAREHYLNVVADLGVTLKVLK